MASSIERSSKRSTTVALVLVAGAGATALALGRYDPSQREEDVLVYGGPDACIRGGIRTETDCRSTYATALAAYPEAAPRYLSLADCEGHHGTGHCVDGTAVATSAAGRFVHAVRSPRLGIYVAMLVVFHMAEFLTTAIYNPSKANVRCERWRFHI